MKLKVGDEVVITTGKDKGKKGKILKVFPGKQKVLVEGVNFYTRHLKKMGDQAGQKIRRERALSVANVAILNDKGQPDRIGYKVNKDGTKERVFKKTGKLVTRQKPEAKKK